MARSWFLVALLIAWGISSAIADEQTRRIQEELRKRNLYFGDVDGRTTPELVSALRHYQRRKGFEETGQIDVQTAGSLNVPIAVAARNPSPAQNWPDVPVLKSDSARRLTESQRAELERAADEASEPTPTIAAPAESPPPSQDLTPQQVQDLVENYLRDAETDDVVNQARYYSFPVDYFDHGMVDRGFIESDTRNYVKRWPQRKYMLLAPPSFSASGKEGETNVEFDIAFSVSGRNHKPATGKTRNYWTIKPEGDELKIIALREQRIP